MEQQQIKLRRVMRLRSKLEISKSRQVYEVSENKTSLKKFCGNRLLIIDVFNNLGL